MAVVLSGGGGGILRRRAPDKDQGASEWEPGSGRVERGETFELAAVREVREETGWVARLGRPFDTFGFRRATGAELLPVTFVAAAPSDTPTLSAEHTEFLWAGQGDDRQLPLADPVRACLELFWAIGPSALGFAR